MSEEEEKNKRLPAEKMENPVSDTESSATASMQPESGAPEVFRQAVDAGVRRLSRTWIEMGASGFIAGMNVTFGVLAAAGVAGAVIDSFGEGSRLFASMLGAAVFPIGFIFVVFGKSELFTENFLVPTAAVIARKKRLFSLLWLWLVTLIGNMAGAVAVAKLISMEHYHGVPSLHSVAYIQHHAEFLVIHRDWDASFFAGLFAGWLITLMTWLLLSTQDNVARIILIWCVGFLIMMSQFNHVVVNSAEILMAIFIGDDKVTYAGWLWRSFVPTIIGNIIGGLVFVTLLEYLKVMRSSSRWH